MERICLIVLAAFIFGCAAAAPVKQSDMAYQKILELPDQPRDVIFEKSKQWIAQTFKSAKAVIEYENKNEGVIIGNGSMDRPLSVVNISSGPLILYNMREDIKDNKVRLTFEKFIAFVPASLQQSYSMMGPEREIAQADLPGMRTNFDSMSENLKKYILSGKSNDNW